MRVVCHGTGPNQQLCACDLSDICKQVPTLMHVMFQVRLLLCFTRCTDELQELHRGGGLSFWAVQVDEHPVLSSVYSGDTSVTLCDPDSTVSFHHSPSFRAR